MKEKTLKIIGISAALSFLLFFNPCHAKIVDRVVARVDNEVIFQTELNNRIEMLLYQAGGGNISGKEKEEFGRNVLNQMIEDKMLILEAEKEQMTIPEEMVKNEIQNIRDNFLDEKEFEAFIKGQGVTAGELAENRIKVRFLVDKKIKVQVTNKEVGQYYQKHKNEMPGSEEEAKAKVRKLLSENKFSAAFKKWMDKIKSEHIVDIKL